MIEITFGFVAAICWGLHDFLVRFIVKKVTIFSALLCTNLFGILFLAGSFFLTEQNFILSETFILISIIYGILFLIATYYKFDNLIRLLKQLLYMRQQHHRKH